MSILYAHPSYHNVAKLIVRPSFSERHAGIENCLIVVGVDAAGVETEFLTLHGGPVSTVPIQIDASNEYRVAIELDADVVLP